MKIKTYFNNAIIGNSSMLACLTDKGQIVRLFWPNIDYPQHIEKLNMGIFFPDRKHSTVWFDEDKWDIGQYYIENTNILKTLYADNEIGVEISQTDFVVPGKDVLIRHYEIKNSGLEEKELGFILYSSFISNNQDIRGSLFDFGNEALIHYRHSYYISISGDRDTHQFQLGNNAFEAANSTELCGVDSIGMMPDGTLSWKLGEFLPGEVKSFTLYICASKTLKDLKNLTNETRKYGWLEKYRLTEKYWKDFFSSVRKVNTGIDTVDNLYKRSLLVFKLMQNESTGGLLAAPEVDEHFTKCGRYAYCWGRDAAFITEALDRCGLKDAVDKFYEWAVNVQDHEGFWHQRYYLDGNLAPSWGLQVDETGTLIWGMLQHYKITNDMGFLEKMWMSVEKGVEFLVSFVDKETGLPKPSYDLWEERMGEHTYSSAAVYSGIIAGVEIAKMLGLSARITGKWEETAAQIKEAIVKVLWKEEYGRFLRSVRTKLNPWGSEYSEEKTLIKVNPKGYYRDVTLEDSTVDVSLLGVCVPFGIFDAGDPKVESTAQAIEQILEFPEVGGIGRYENDNYISGNPWVIATLWVALYHIRKKNYHKAKEYFKWAVNARTKLDFLPEQVDKYTGKPAWIIPLTWSHAMFVLVLFELIEAEVI
ncbi:MAG: glycoside hydrolase [Firmicutes bacterium]|nr:glycoside hydrolase [Bacillota bacterium]